MRVRASVPFTWQGRGERSRRRATCASATTSRRCHLVEDVIDRVPGLGPGAAYVRQEPARPPLDHAAYIETDGDDAPEIRDLHWPLD